MEYELCFECFTMYRCFSSMATGGGGTTQGQGAPKRLSSVQRLSCESVIVGVGFQRAQREAERSKPVSHCAWKRI